MQARPRLKSARFQHLNLIKSETYFQLTFNLKNLCVVCLSTLRHYNYNLCVVCLSYNYNLCVVCLSTLRHYNSCPPPPLLAVAGGWMVTALASPSLYSPPAAAAAAARRLWTSALESICAVGWTSAGTQQPASPTSVTAGQGKAEEVQARPWLESTRVSNFDCEKDNSAFNFEPWFLSLQPPTPRRRRRRGRR